MDVWVCRGVCSEAATLGLVVWLLPAKLVLLVRLVSVADHLDYGPAGASGNFCSACSHCCCCCGVVDVSTPGLVTAGAPVVVPLPSYRVLRAYLLLLVVILLS